MRFACIAALLVLSACPGSTVMDASRYDQSCTQAADCTVVYSGDVCAVCTCPNDAIAASSLSAWNTELARAKQWCGPIPAIACAPCPIVMASCVAGKCTTAAAP